MKPTDTNPPPKPNGEKSLAPVSLSDVEPLEDQVREIYGRTVYSHKTHIIQAGMYQAQNWWIKTGQIVLGAITTTGLIVTLFGKDNQVGLVVSAVCSALLTALIAYTKDFDLGTVAEQHKRTSDELWLVRENYLSLLTDMGTGAVDGAAAMRRRDGLLDDLNKAYAPARVTTSRAYAAAQKALKMKEDLTFSSDEIDMFLPVGLRRNKALKGPPTI